MTLRSCNLSSQSVGFLANLASLCSGVSAALLDLTCSLLCLSRSSLSIQICRHVLRTPTSVNHAGNSRVMNTHTSLIWIVSKPFRLDILSVNQFGYSLCNLDCLWKNLQVFHVLSLVPFVSLVWGLLRLAPITQKLWGHKTHFYCEN